MIQNEQNAPKLTQRTQTFNEKLISNKISQYQLYQPQVIHQNHHKVITCVAFSPDGKIFATGSQVNYIKLWDLSSQTCYQTMKLSKGYAILCLEFSPNSKLLISGGADGYVRSYLKDSNLNYSSSKYHKHKSWVTSIAIAPNEEFIVSASLDKQIFIYDFHLKEKIAILRTHQDWINTVSVSPDSKIVISAGDDKSIKLWNTKTFEQIQSIDDHKTQIYSSCWLRDKNQFITGMRDGTLRLHEEDKIFQCSQVIQAHLKGINFIELSPDGKSFLTVSEDLTIKQWNAESLECMNQTNYFTARSIEGFARFSSDGKFIFASGYFIALKCLNAENFQKLNFQNVGFDSSVTEFNLTNDSKIVITGESSGEVKLWDTQTLQCRAKFNDNIRYIRRIEIFGDDQYFATISGSSIVNFYDLRTFNAIKLEAIPTDLEQVMCMKVYLRDQIFATGHQQGKIKLWNFQTMEKINETSNICTENVETMQFSPDGATLSIHQYRSSVRIYNTKNLKCIRKFRYSGYFCRFQYSPNGTIFVICWENGYIEIFETQSFKRIKILYQHVGGPSYVFKMGFLSNKWIFHTGQDRMSFINLLTKEKKNLNDGGYIGKTQATKYGKDKIVSCTDGVVSIYNL